MALLDIANTDRVITITPLTGMTPAVPVYVENVSVKVKANNKGCIFGDISWTIAGCTGPGVILFGIGSGSMSPTAVKVNEMVLSMKPIRLNDTGQCSGIITDGAHFAQCFCQYTVTDAGQSKAKAQ